MLAALSGTGSFAAAQTAFILQDGTGFEGAITTNLTSRLTNAGYGVTNGTSLPALNSFREVWDVEFNNTTPLTPGNQAAYLAYLQGGGTLFLDGENTGFVTRNNSILAFLAALGAGNVPATSVNANDTQTVLGTVATTPNVLPTLGYLAASGIANPGNGICITKDTNNICSAIGYPVNSLANARRGTVVVVFDVNYLDRPSDTPSQNFIDNLIAFLGSGGGGSLTLQFPVGPTNQVNVAAAINTSITNGSNIPAGFQALNALTPSQLATALSQLSGEAATDSQRGAFQMMTEFLGLMTDPFVDGRAGMAGPGGVRGFAAEEEPLPPELASAYAAVFKAPAAKTAPFEQRWSMWGSAYGGSGHTNGDVAGVGSHDFSARTGGFAAGADYLVSPFTIVGFALAGGGTNWSLAEGLGGGRSDVFQAGVYGKTSSGPMYAAASFGFAEHWVSTERTAFNSSNLTASFDAQSFGGRVEAGYRIASPVVAVTPYGAVQAQAFVTPSYSESDPSGSGFGLTFGSRIASAARGEAGARFDHAVALDPTSLLILRGKLAYAQDLVSDPTLAAVFQSLPASSFIVNGANPPPTSALVAAGAELRLANGLAISAKFDGEFAGRSQTYAGTGKVRYTW
jgi:uncharacterized protein with beta-barrel porin domain